MIQMRRNNIRQEIIRSYLLVSIHSDIDSPYSDYAIIVAQSKFSALKGSANSAPLLQK
jgi:hypothetical protein